MNVLNGKGGPIILGSEPSRILPPHVNNTRAVRQSLPDANTNRSVSQNITKSIMDAFRGNKNIESNDKETKDILGVTDTNTEQTKILKHVSETTDDIEDLLKQMKGDVNKNNSSLLGMLSKLALLEGILAAMGGVATAVAVATNPQAVKPVLTTVKVAQTIAQAAKNAKKIKDAVKTADTVAEAAHVAKVTAGTATGAHVATTLTHAAKMKYILSAPQAKSGYKMTGLGAASAGSRLLMGDNVGAGMEAASTVLGRSTSLKMKGIALGLDVASMGRDYYRYKTGASAHDGENLVKNGKNLINKTTGINLGADKDGNGGADGSALPSTDPLKVGAVAGGGMMAANAAWKLAKHIKGGKVGAAVQGAEVAGKVGAGLFSKVGGLFTTSPAVLEAREAAKIATLSHKAANATHVAAQSNLLRSQGLARGGSIGTYKLAPTALLQSQASKATLEANKALGLGASKITGISAASPTLNSVTREAAVAKQMAIRTGAERISAHGELNAASKSAGLGSRIAAKAGAVVSKGTPGLGALAGKAGLKAGGKLIAKSLPFVGLAMGAYGAVTRGMEGDYKGAALEVVAGLASFVPVIGTAASFSIQAGLAVRDINKELNKTAATTATGVDALQKSANDSMTATTKTSDALAKSMTTGSEGMFATMRESAKSMFGSISGFMSGLGTGATALAASIIPGGAVVAAGVKALNNAVDSHGSVDPESKSADSSRWSWDGLKRAKNNALEAVGLGPTPSTGSGSGSGSGSAGSGPTKDATVAKPLTKTAGAAKPADEKKAGSKGQTKAQYAMAYLQSKGWSKAQAAGIVGNLQVESGNFSDAVISGRKRGDNNHAWGIAQWRDDAKGGFRKQDAEKFMGKPFGSATLDDQLNFVDHELRNGKEKRAGANLSGASDAATAGRIVDRDYERSDGKSRNLRAGNATSLFNGGTGGGKAGDYSNYTAGDGTPADGSSSGMDTKDPDSVAGNVAKVLADMANSQGAKDFVNGLTSSPLTAKYNPMTGSKATKFGVVRSNVDGVGFKGNSSLYRKPGNVNRNKFSVNGYNLNGMTPSQQAAYDEKAFADMKITATTTQIDPLNDTRSLDRFKSDSDVLPTADVQSQLNANSKGMRELRSAKTEAERNRIKATMGITDQINPLSSDENFRKDKALMDKVNITATTTQIDPLNDTRSLDRFRADTSERDNIAQLIDQHNLAMSKAKNAAANVNVTIPPTTPVATLGSDARGSAASAKGLNAPMIVRNPDSIIQQTAIMMMKASISS